MDGWTYKMHLRNVAIVYKSARFFQNKKLCFSSNISKLTILSLVFPLNCFLFWCWRRTGYSAAGVVEDEWNDNESEENLLVWCFNQFPPLWRDKHRQWDYTHFSICMYACDFSEGYSWRCIRVSSVEMHWAVLWERPWHESQKLQSGWDSIQLHRQIPGKGLFKMEAHANPQ